jgi:hypothetical protein
VIQIICGSACAVGGCPLRPLDPEDLPDHRREQAGDVDDAPKLLELGAIPSPL